MKKLLSYDEYVRDDSFAEKTGYSFRRYGTIDFYRDKSDSTCPFCQIEVREAHKDSHSSRPDWLGGGSYDVQEYVWQCHQCGWWRIRTNKQTDGDIDAISAIVKSAVLKKYDLSSKDIPIRILQEYLRDRFEDVIHIHDKQMEKLVQSVFSEHFSCHVEHVGKSSDGGIDLILVQSDSPTVVQVKRRKSLSHVEAVGGVREFLGASLLRKSKKCIFVSTSSRFSEASQKEAKLAVDDGLVESYELYDFSRFSDALKLSKKSQEEPWRRYVGAET